MDSLAWQQSCPRSILAQGGTGRIHSHKEAGIGSKDDWAAYQTLAQEAGHLANISISTQQSPTPKSSMSASQMRSTRQICCFCPIGRLPRGKNVYKYALTVVDIASRYKAAEPLTSKDSYEVAAAFTKAYQRGQMKWPKVLYVDPGKELFGAVSQLLRKHSVAVRRGVAGAEGAHREQSNVEHFNQILVEHLFGHQYAQEMRFPRAPKEGQRFTEWVQRLPAVVAALKCEATRLTGRKPVEAIKLKNTAQKPSYVYHRPVD